MVANLRSWPARRWATAALAAVALALVIGGPTDVIPNPLATRVIPVAWWSYPTLAATAILGGLLAATYVRSPAVRSPAQPTGGGKTAGGGLLSALAIGCPVCNKLVVLALGTSGALTVWSPLQPLLAIASVALLGWALRTRLAAEGACRLPEPTAVPTQCADPPAASP